MLPLLVTLMLGIWDYGRLVEANQVLTNAAREAGRQCSTAQKGASSVQTVALNYLTRAGVPTTGVTVAVSNLTNSSRADPSGASQLDKYEVVVTMPSNNVRLILMNSLIGPGTITARCTWSSMVDIPVSVPASIPLN